MSLLRSWVHSVIVLILGLVFWAVFIDLQHPLPDSYIGQDISTILSAMPKKDRKKIECYFREAIGWSQFGYVLIGEKPMALDVIPEKIHPFASYSAFRSAISPRRIQIQKGYQTWKKYEKFFPTSQFIILEERENDNLLIILVNKNMFINQINQHKQDFETVLKREINGELLLQEAQIRPLLTRICMNHDGLIGIILGYGRNNSFLFHQHSQISPAEEQIRFVETHHLGSIWTQEEFENFRKKFEPISMISTYITGAHMQNLELMALPGFMAQMPSIETENLRTKYIKAKQKIIDYYKNKDFLEATLRLITS